MANRRSSSKKENKKYSFQFTLSSLFLICAGFVFILAWIFSLGIMVGRGFLPDTVNALREIREKIVPKEQPKEISLPEPIQEEELTFYNQLIDKKNRTKNKALSESESLSDNQDRKTEHLNTEGKKEESGRYYIQIAALRDKNTTEKLVKQLIEQGYPAYHCQSLVDGKMLYRIRCGPFSSLKEARNGALSLGSKEGYKPFIIYPSKSD